ncbi:PH domain-containing protein [uncultured Serinicoccus sp.]|uniref:PH domain-containing protein n=1 Tax=uncultured Serinicoccus sp. TaxID=735514 RepID=UPI002617F432|nr:PH domain-containing protein [uncultured Serinicoccus sp.]
MSAHPSTAPRISRRVAKRYLLTDERVVVSTRWHWAKLLKPGSAVAVALFLTLWVAASVTEPAATGLALSVLAVVCAWAGWQVLEWRCEWFIATDRRLLKTYGLITQRVAMMPLVKVTDMSYDRTIAGRLLGYGRFVMESAGQDQALSHIDYIPQPDAKYQAMCETIFGRDVRDPGEDDDGWDDEGYADGPDHRTGDPGRGSWGQGQGQDRTGSGGAVVGRRQQWEPVDPGQLPSDWDWEGETPGPRRAPTRRRVAVDPDPTPLR